MNLEVERLEYTHFRLDEARRCVAKATLSEKALDSVETDQVVVRAELAG